MFYKKESDRQIFSGTESEFEEIAEVKPTKKVLKITESDFENELAKDKSRGGSKKPNFASNNSQKDEQRPERVKRLKNKIAEDSMTEQSDDDARFNSANQQNRLGQRSKAMSSDDRLTRSDGFMQQSRGQRKAPVGNITNIINNNNINNFIINDPSKAPPAFHMAQAQQQLGLQDGRV